MSAPNQPKSKTKSRSKSARRSHQKATTITSPDGWTHVVRGPAAVVHRASTDVNGNNTKNNALPAYTLGPPPLTTLAELQAEHARQVTVLTTREPTAQLMRALRREVEGGLAAHPNVAGGVTRAVCVGLGSLSAGRRVTAFRQLIAFEVVLEVLAEMRRGRGDGEAEGEKRDGEILGNGDGEADGHEASRAGTHETGLPVYFQELNFTPLDETFLASRGYSVVPVPSDVRGMILNPTTKRAENVVVLGPIETYMTDSTFFFAPHLEIDMINHAATKEPPLLYFGTNMRSWYERQESLPRRSQVHGPRKTRAGSSEASAPVIKGSPASHGDEMTELHQKPRVYWTDSFDWRAPGGIERLAGDEGAWASDFALAFRIS